MSGLVEFVCRNRERCFVRKIVAEMHAEVVLAELCGNAEMNTVNLWNRSENSLAEVFAEVCGNGVANPLISLSAEVSLALYGNRRRASPASLRFAAIPPVGRCIPNSYFEIGYMDVGLVRKTKRPPSRSIPLGHFPEIRL
jgi:hypothetical protein